MAAVRRELSMLQAAFNHGNPVKLEDVAGYLRDFSMDYGCKTPYKSSE